MSIGIIGAMEEEIAALREAMEITGTETIAGMEFAVGKLRGTDAVVVQSGIGKVNAGVCAQILITHFGAHEIINIGDIVISTDAVQHDYDVSPIGFRRGEIPYTGLYAFPADAGLRERAHRAAEKFSAEVRCYEGRVCSGDQFIASKAQKSGIIETFGGLCCEMEGAAVAQVCHLNRVPWVIIRAISDKADDSGKFSFETFKRGAARRGTAIALELAAQA